MKQPDKAIHDQYARQLAAMADDATEDGNGAEFLLALVGIACAAQVCLTGEATMDEEFCALVRTSLQTMRRLTRDS